jgi:hypothetical protein
MTPRDPVPMHDLYGDGSDCIGCAYCGLCISHGDCECPDDEDAPRVEEEPETP